MRTLSLVVGATAVTLVAVMGAAVSKGEARASAAFADQAVTATDATARIAAAAQVLLKALDDSGRAKLQFRFDDDVQRRRWSNFPSGIFERRGLRVGDLTPPQRQALTGLLQTALSPRGYTKGPTSGAGRGAPHRGGHEGLRTSRRSGDARAEPPAAQPAATRSRAARSGRSGTRTTVRSR